MVNVIAETTNGAARGARSGDVLSWKGIPFAAPPIGQLRFARPEPAPVWSGVRDCTRFGPAAPQHQGFLSPIVDGVGESEDCLTLNVWAPAAAEPRGRAVLVWIHGCAYMAGAGAEHWSDGTYLAEHEDIVVVSVNYRLGALGGLALDDTGTLGNNFLLDVVQALRWLQENVAAFGGDPERVTIAGESAGAFIVAALIASPYARGLFRAGIVQSGHGSGNAPLAAAHRARDLFLAELGVEHDERLMARARSAELADLLRAQQVTAGQLVTPFKPVIDGDVLPAGVLDLFAGGVQQPVPLLLGTNRDEHNLFAANGWGHGTGHTAPLRERLQGMIVDGDPAMADNLATSYAKLAVGAEGGWSADEAAWNIVRTDLDWRGPQRELALAHADAGAPVYRYEFAFRTPVYGGVLGAAHSLDIPFVFGNLDRPGMAERTGDDAASPDRRRVSAQCTQAWASFVRDGRPASQHLPEWPRYDRDGQQIMVIGPDPSVLADPHADRLATWEQIRAVAPLSS
ncbi:carboxylesterase family protein [Streptomyces sp. NPDC046942]|uniref:carboxylesterase/lipase family protein n=1 Tax=Streptomyces sp. NPDC046942 TaxID=3155137 RepID=UPI0033DDF92B